MKDIHIKSVIEWSPLPAAKVHKEVKYYFKCPFCDLKNSLQPEPKKAFCLNPECKKEIFLSWY